MISVTFEFLAQARTAAMRNQARVQFASGVDLPAALREVARQQGDALQSLMFDPQGELRASLLVMVNGQFVRATESQALSDGDTITLLTPIGGG